MERIPDPIKKFGPAAIFLLLLVIFQWHLIAAWPPLLVCLLSLAVMLLGTYSLLRSRIVPLDKSLQDSHYERFQRLQGLYNAIAPVLRSDPSTRDAAAEFERQATKLEAMVDKAGNKFTHPNAQNEVHNLHLVFLQIEPVDYLALSIQTLESDYRQTAGAGAYEAYLSALLRNNPTDPPPTVEKHTRMLRVDATFLANESRRQDLLKQHVEQTRQTLLRSAFRSWWWNVIPLMAILIVYLSCEAWIGLVKPSPLSPTSAPNETAAATPAPTPTTDDRNWEVNFVNDYLLEPRTQSQAKLPADGYTTLYRVIIMATLLALAGIAGASGGMMSVVQRIQSGMPDSDASTDLRALSLAETAVFFAPVTGLIFAIVLSLIFASRAINGTLFPNIPTDGYWYHTLWDAPEMAKWILWAFVAGFSERLVPDMLDTLTKQRAADGKTSAPVGGTTPPRPPAAKGPGGISNGPAADAKSGTDDKEGRNGQDTVTDEDSPAQTSPTLVLDPHPDTIPADATVLTITGKNFDQTTQVYVNDQLKTVTEYTASSLKLYLAESDLQGQTIRVVASNAGGNNAGRSNTLMITVGDPGE